jgi:DNA-binding Lrp family transcriptional regulator
MRHRPLRRLALAFLALLAAPAAARAAHLPVSGGPKELLIAYRAAPADRPAFRTYLATQEIARLRKLEAEGVLKSCEILFNPFVQPSTFDAVAILSFNRFEDTARWQDLEKTMPGGLDRAGLKLAKPVWEYSADLEWDGAAANPGPVRDHVFYMIPYSYSAADAYRKFIDAYVTPQTEGWIREGVLSRYRIFMNRYQVGDPWDALFVYEYRDLTSFGRREETVAKVREPLRQDPQWKQLNDTKGSLRSESENTIASHLAGC